MWTVIFAVTTVVCAIGWLNRWVTTTAMIMYFLGKGCPEPTEEEMKACLSEVWHRVLTLKF